MKFTLPPVFSINHKHKSGNYILQIAKKSEALVPKGIRVLDLEGIRGYHLDGKEDYSIVVCQKTKSPIGEFDMVILTTKLTNSTLDDVAIHRDWNYKYWAKHPKLINQITSSTKIKAESEGAFKSWENGFKFIDEKKDDDGLVTKPGLRPPQIGALYALLAHWAISKKIATVVLPTGVGKTETMLAAMIANQCRTVLVVVPTDALREQIGNKFLELGLLKELGLIEGHVKYPVVGILKKKFKGEEIARDYFKCCNVVVSTMNIVAQSTTAIQEAIAEQCEYLFIDEAHHTEAKTWKAFKRRFEKTIVQFTATPFRNDGKEIDGKFIFEYTLRQAQTDEYYKPIEFHEVQEWLPENNDQAIAQKAVELLTKDNFSEGKDHILMARVLTIDRAEEVYRIYKEKYDRPEFNPVRIHTRMTAQERLETKDKILSGKTRIIICVDMLGEGFDLPQLKIAAFHDIRQSLPITIQIVGRFTRALPNLGNAKIVANIADPKVSKELAQLYTYGADWNVILADINAKIITKRDNLLEFFRDFDEAENNISIQSLWPSLSAIIYSCKTSKWTPEEYESGLSNFHQYDKVYTNFNRKQRVALIILGKRQRLIWARSKEIYDWRWDMIILYRDVKNGLLYVHTTNNSNYYKTLARTVAGKVNLIKGQQVFRIFHGLHRIRLKNVGTREQFGRLVSYIGRFGSDVEGGTPTRLWKGKQKVVVAKIGHSIPPSPD